MGYTFDPNLPIYIQVMDEIKKDIVNKKYLPDQKILSVRELALYYGVNPNTIQKALTELEREGLLRSERAVGRFVTNNLEVIEGLKQSLSYEKIKMFVEEMSALGFSKEEMVQCIQNYQSDK